MFKFNNTIVINMHSFVTLYTGPMREGFSWNIGPGPYEPRRDL